MARSTVTCRMSAQLFADYGTSSVRVLGWVSVQMSYDPADPFAIKTTFTDTNHGVVVWSIARDLLADAVEGLAPVGVGDVRLTPMAAGKVRMHLSSPTGRATLIFNHDHLAEAVAATERLVPRGTEPDRIDWDGELAGLGVA